MVVWGPDRFRQLDGSHQAANRRRNSYKGYWELASVARLREEHAVQGRQRVCPVRWAPAITRTFASRAGEYSKWC